MSAATRSAGKTRGNRMALAEGWGAAELDRAPTIDRAGAHYGSLVTATELAVYFELDRERGAAFFVSLAERCVVDHIRCGEEFIFDISTVEEQLAWHHWRQLPDEARESRIAIRVETATSAAVSRVADEPPEFRAARFVEPSCAGDRPAVLPSLFAARRLGWRPDADIVPVAVRAVVVERELARLEWVRLPARERAALVRSLMEAHERSRATASRARSTQTCAA